MEDSAENFPLTVAALIELYLPVKPQIEARLMDFRHIWETASDEDLFRELIFCLLTPQSKAKTCWKAVQRLERKCMIAEAVPAAITEELVGVRFNQRKAEYICLARIAVRRSIPQEDAGRFCRPGRCPGMAGGKRQGSGL